MRRAQLITASRYCWTPKARLAALEAGHAGEVEALQSVDVLSRHTEPGEVDTIVRVEIAHGAAAGGLVTEVIALRLLYARQKGNLNMKGAFWHVMQTFVGSILIIVAALVIRFTGFLAIDPILGMGFGVVLVWASWGIIRGALRILLQAVPDDLDLGAVKEAVERLGGVTEAHHLHAWALTTGKDVVSLHVLVDEGTDAQALQRHVFALLRDDFDVYFSTVQVETTCLEREEARAIDATWAGPGASAAMPPGTVERGASSVVIGPTKPTSNGLHGPPR